MAIEMNGGVAPNKILALLSDSEVNGPVSAQFIARQIGKSLAYTRDVLTKLKKADLVREAKGEWTVSPMGRELHNQDPYFGPHQYEQPKASSRDFWLELIDWEYVENDCYLRRLIEHAADLESWKPVTNYLLPYVLTFLAANGMDISRTFKTELPEWTDKGRDQDRLFNELVDWIGKQI